MSARQHCQLLAFVSLLTCVGGCVGIGIMYKSVETYNKPLFALERKVGDFVNNDYQLLFSAGLENQDGLNNSTLSDDLRQKFRDNGINLSQNVNVAVKEADRQWMITEKNSGQTYLVRKENDTLNIYDYRYNDPDRYNDPGRVLAKTKSDVLALWGEPVKRSTSGSTERWFYNLGLGWAGLVPILLVPIPLIVPIGYLQTVMVFEGDMLTGIEKQYEGGVVCGYILIDHTVIPRLGCRVK